MLLSRRVSGVGCGHLSEALLVSLSTQPFLLVVLRLVFADWLECDWLESDWLESSMPLF